MSGLEEPEEMKQNIGRPYQKLILTVICIWATSHSLMAQVSLLDRLLSTDSLTSEQAMVELERTAGSQRQDLAAALGDAATVGDTARRLRALRLLGTLRAGGPQLAPKLLVCLKEPDPAIRESAALALRRIAPLPAETLIQLTPALRDENPLVRKAALDAVCRSSVSSVDIDKDLIRLLQDDNVEIQRVAIFCALRRPPKGPLRDVILRLATHPDPSVRIAVTTALLSSSEISEKTLRVVMNLASDKEPSVRAAALQTLSPVLYQQELMVSEDRRMTVNPAQVPQEPKLAPLFFKALSDTDPTVVKAALQGSQFRVHMSPGESKQILALSKSNDPEIRKYAIRMARQTSGSAERTMALLSAALKDQDPGIRLDAMQALPSSYRMRNDPNSGDYVNMALPLLNDSAPEVRLAALQYLAAFQPMPSQVLDAFRTLVNSADHKMRYEAQRTLLSAGAVDVKLINASIKQIHETDKVYERETLIAHLGSIKQFPEIIVPALKSFLQDPSPNVRQAAFRSLAQMSADPSAKATVFAAVNHRDPIMRRLALDAIGEGTQISTDAVKVLQDRLNDPVSEVKLASARALGRIGPVAAPTFPTLILLTRSPDIELARACRDSAAALYSRTKRNDLGVQLLPVVIRGLDQKDLEDRKRAAEILRSLDLPLSQKKNAIARVLRDPNVDMRQAGIQGIRYREKLDSSWIPMLTPLLKDQNVEIRIAAAELLSDIPAGKAESVKGLMKLIASQDTTIQIKALNVLACTHPLPDDASAMFVRLLHNSDEKRQELAIQWLQGETVIPPAALSDLRNIAFRDPFQRRVNAIYLIGRMGENAKPAIPDLIGLASDPEVKVRRAAIGALVSSKLHSPDIEETLANAANDGDEYIRNMGTRHSSGVSLGNRQSVADLLAVAREGVGRERQEAIRRLGTINSTDTAKLEALFLELLSDPAADIRLEAAKTSDELKLRSLEFEKSFTRLLADPDPRVAQQSAKCLGRFASSSAEMVTGLIKACDHKTPAVRAAALFALSGKIEYGGMFIPTATRLLDDPEPDVRRDAIVALMWQAPKNEKVYPLLVGKLKDPSSDVRSQAISAMYFYRNAPAKVVPHLKAMLTDSSDVVRRHAQDILSLMKNHQGMIKRR
jgi:HEAT repeat protein